VAAFILIVAGCSPAASAYFDPNGPCTSDGKAAGAYPSLEARIPGAIAGTARASLDSGRNCTAQNLGTLAGHGVSELRFAGGVWQDGAQEAITLAVFQAPGLQAEWIAEWYEASARAARRTGSIQPSKPIVDGRQAFRMDLVNGESVQAVIAWPSADGDVVQVVLAADEPESRVQAALDAFP
jgi:hypothetical protein